MTLNQNDGNNNKDVLKKQIITFFIKNGFLVSTELMDALLREKNPLETCNDILNIVKENAASLAVITIADFPQELLATSDETIPRESSPIPTETTMNDSLVAIAHSSENVSHLPHPSSSQEQWNVKVINWTHQIDINGEITTKELQNLQKLHDLEVAREYLRLLQNSSNHAEKQDLDVAVIIQKQQHEDTINIVLELPLKGNLVKFSLKSSHVSDQELELLSRLPIYSMIGLIKDDIGEEKILRVIRPNITRKNIFSGQNDNIPASPQRDGNNYVLMVTIPSSMSMTSEFFRKFLEFIKNKNYLVPADEKQNERIISLNNVQLMLMLLNTDRSVNHVEKTLLARKPMMPPQVQVLIKWLEVINSQDRLTASTSIIFQGSDFFWSQEAAHIPSSTLQIPQALPESVNFMTSPGKIEITRSSANQTLRIFSYLGLGTSRESSLEMIKLMIDLRHIHLIPPDIIHLPPKRHEVCVFQSLPDIFIHDVGKAPLITHHHDVTIINASRPETVIIVDLETKHADQAYFTKKDET